MNIVNKVTLRHLKENKRRTLVTIFGVIISVAMITAVATLGVSFIDMQQRDAISHNGDWHYAMHDIDKEQLKAIQADDHTESVGLIEELGYAPLNKQLEKRYLYVRAMDETAMEQMQVKLTAGRLPTNENEVVISEKLRGEDFPYQLGDTIELDIGERYEIGGEDRILGQDDSLNRDEDGVGEEIRNPLAHSFTLVGEIEEPIWDYPWSPGYTMLSYTDGESLSEIDGAYVHVNKLSNTLFVDVEELQLDIGVDAEQSEFNTGLLDTHLISLNSGMVTVLSGLLSIIIVIIMIGAIVLIYNAFAISVSERSRYLGMLSSVGATKRQKRNSVLFEGVVIGLISIPIGIGAGLLGIGITLHLINNMLLSAGFNSDIHLVVTLPIFIIAIVVSFLTIMISAWIPAVRASRITAIDAIRQSEDIKLTKRKVKTNRFVRKLFGYEAEIALKNLKRNKKRYHVTVFSLMISIILFLSVGFFTNTLTKSYELQSEAQNYDLSIRDSSDGNKLAELFPAIENMKHVNDSMMYQRINLSAYIPEGLAGDTMEYTDEEMVDQGALAEEGVYYTINLIGLPEKAWDDYLHDNHLAVPSHEKQSAVLVNTVSYLDYDNKYVETEMLHVNEGDLLPLRLEHYNEKEDDWEIMDEGELNLIGLTDHLPMGYFYPSMNTLIVIVNEQTFNGLMESIPNGYNQIREAYLTSDDPYQVQEDIEALNQSSGLEISNIYEFQQQDKQLTLAISIFIYGFIILITLISIANIFNTISTSVALRKREFATMKSIGMTPKAFNKMIRFESLFYGIKSLIYGLPISIIVMYCIHVQTRDAFDYRFQLPWGYITIVILAVFTIVGVAMIYSTSKLKKDNIVETLKQENI